MGGVSDEDSWSGFRSWGLQRTCCIPLSLWMGAARRWLRLEDIRWRDRLLYHSTLGLRVTEKRRRRRRDRVAGYGV